MSIIWDAATGALATSAPSPGMDDTRLRYWVSRSGRIPAGTYTLDPGAHGPLRIPGGVTLDLTGVTIQCAPQSSERFDMLLIDGVADVTIRGGRIVGDRATHLGATGEHGMGLRIQNSSRITLDGTTISDHWGDCIYIGGGSYAHGEACRGIRITGCTLTGARRQGISITHADGVTIDGCTITNIRGTSPEYGIDVETNDPAHPCRNVSVRDCTFSSSAGGGFVVGAPAENVTVTGCTFQGDGVNLTNLTGGTVTGCTIVGATVSVSSGSARVTVNGNTISDGSVELYSNGGEVSDVAISGNTFTGGSPDRKAIAATGANPIRRISIDGNAISGYTSESIYLYTGIADGAISGNVIESEPSRWVALMRGSLTVRGNHIRTSTASPFSGEGTPASMLDDNDLIVP